MGIVVLQALLLPSAQADQSLLVNIGFYSAAELLTWPPNAVSFPSQLPLLNLDCVNVSPDDERLRELVEASYHGSLDCPVIDGWRDIDDVLGGYQATGTYRADLWWLMQQNQQVVGCMIVADYPHLLNGSWFIWESILDFEVRDSGSKWCCGYSFKHHCKMWNASFSQSMQRIIRRSRFIGLWFCGFDRRLALAMKL